MMGYIMRKKKKEVKQPKTYAQPGYAGASLEDEKKEIENIIKRPLLDHEVKELKKSKLNIFNDKNDDLTITY